MSDIDLDDLPSKKKVDENEQKKKNYDELVEAEKLKLQIKQQQKGQTDENKGQDDYNEEEMAALNPFNDDVILEKTDQTTKKVKKIAKKRQEKENSLLNKKPLSILRLLLTTIVFSGLQFGCSFFFHNFSLYS